MARIPTVLFFLHRMNKRADNDAQIATHDLKITIRINRKQNSGIVLLFLSRNGIVSPMTVLCQEVCGDRRKRRSRRGMEERPPMRTAPPIKNSLGRNCERLVWANFRMPEENLRKGREAHKRPITE
jgi:hypothetical protein